MGTDKVPTFFEDEQWKYRYTFVFTAGESTTNIQVAELAALLPLGLADARVPVFVGRDGQAPAIRAPHVYIARFSQSCQVLSPCEVDLRPIVSRAGYVHSCGPTVVCRAWDTVDARMLIDSIVSYASRVGKKLEFEVTDKRGYDKEGIEGVLVDGDRYFLGQQKFSAARAIIATNIVAAYAERGLSDDGDGALFIIKDVLRYADEKGIVQYIGRDELLYLITYHSLYKKRDALARLDESKPFWAGIFTTPQALTAAMLNLARVNGKSTVLDPFSHQGSTAVQASAFGARVILYGDKSEVWGTRDNVTFLTDARGAQEEVVAELKRIEENEIESYRRVAQDSLREAASDGAFATRTRPIEDIFASFPGLFNALPSRLMFYLLSRLYIKHASISNKLNREWEVFHDLVAIREQLVDFVQTIARGGHYKRTGRIRTFSASAIPTKRDFGVFAGCAECLPIVSHSIDVIVGDPPYGYGSDLNHETLQRLYDGFFGEALRVLKPGGWLVLCLLDKVRTGKQIDSRFKSSAIVRLIAEKARTSGVEFQPQVVGVDTYGFPAYAPYSAYYWKATYALNRAIVAFQIKHDPSHRYDVTCHDGRSVTELFACPRCKSPLADSSGGVESSLVCASRDCGKEYQVRDGVPVFLV